VQEADLLLTTAQIGMALAGFASLVTLLRRPAPRTDARLNEIRFRSMMELSLTLAVFSLLPFVLAALRLPEPASWRSASAVYAVASAVFLAYSVRRNQRIGGRLLVAGAVTAALFLVCTALALMLASNALGAFRGVEPGVYVAALFVHFTAAAFFFIRLLYGAFPRDDA
jgi:uncharacterized membrane protein YozB (DUF420 family)